MAITVKAQHDPEAGVWYIADSDLPGLRLEGDSLDQLYAKLAGGIEDLTGNSDVDFQLVAEGHQAVA
jgi:Domain of unknown function (DUF1902)